MTLSNTDVSKSDSEWECSPLDFDTVLQEGEHFVYYMARVLNYLSVSDA